MSVTYLNIGGTTCIAFDLEKPSDIPNVILYNENPTSGVKTVLKTDFSTVTTPNSGSVTTIGSNALSVSDFKFILRYSEVLALGDVPKPNSRALIISPTSAVDTNRYIESANNQWSAGTVVTYQGQSYKIAISSSDDSAVQGLIGDTLPTMTGTVIANTDFYLRRYTPLAGVSPTSETSQIYLSSTTLSDQDVSLASVLASDVVNNGKFRFIVKTENGRKIFKIIKSSDSTEVDNLVVYYDNNVTPSYYVTKFPDGAKYCLDTVTPTDEQISAYTITLIKSNSKFVTLNWSRDATTFSLRDYWSSGLTKAQLQERMMFRWYDLTPNSPLNPIVGSKEDIYRWGVTNTVLPTSLNYIYCSADGTYLINDTTEPPANEGWAFANTGTSLSSLVYIRSGTEVGYLSVSPTDSTTVLYTQLTPGGTIPATANVFTCVKCSNINNGLCTPTP